MVGTGIQGSAGLFGALDVSLCFYWVVVTGGDSTGSLYDVKVVRSFEQLRLGKTMCQSEFIIMFRSLPRRER